MEVVDSHEVADKSSDKTENSQKASIDAVVLQLYGDLQLAVCLSIE